MAEFEVSGKSKMAAIAGSYSRYVLQEFLIEQYIHGNTGLTELQIIFLLLFIFFVDTVKSKWEIAAQGGHKLS